MLILWCQGRGQVRRQIWLYGGCSYYGGWGSFGTDIGHVNIVGGRGPGAEFGDVSICGVRVTVGCLGQISGMLIFWGQGRGRGQGLGDRHWG